MSLKKEILFEKYADIGFVWQGEVAVAEFERLGEHLDMSAQTKNPTLDVAVRLSKKDNTVWLDCTIKGTLWVDCDRCLEPLTYDIDKQYATAIVRNASEVSSLVQMGAEYVLFAEVSHDGRFLPLFDMVEDELLLDLPSVQTHDDCTMAVETVGEIVETPKDNPFAILAQLKS